jgi:hypothetical protein
MKTPTEIQESVKIIPTIIQRTFSARGTELHDRLQWPLFLAGIETRDTIYRDWILSRITSNRVAEALQQVIDAQESAGMRMSMIAVRDLLYHGHEPGLVTGTSSYLMEMPASRAECKSNDWAYEGNDSSNWPHG